MPPCFRFNFGDDLLYASFFYMQKYNMRLIYLNETQIVTRCPIRMRARCVSYLSCKTANDS